MTRRSIYDKDTIDPFSCSTRSCVLCPAYLLRTGLVDVQDDGIGKDSMNMPIISSLLLHRLDGGTEATPLTAHMGRGWSNSRQAHTIPTLHGC